MTRAVQTALYALHNHKSITTPTASAPTAPKEQTTPAPKKKECGLHLISSVREIKGIGGLDTVGRAYGPDLRQRVFDETQQLRGVEQVGLGDNLKR